METTKLPWGFKITIFLLVIACLFLGYKYFTLRMTMNTPQTVYVTDTVYVDRPYKIEVPGPTKVVYRPQRIYIYAKDSVTPSTVSYGNLDSLQNANDSLGVQNLLLKTYETWYSTYNKSQLLNMDLGKDSLRLVLFDKTGTVQDKRYVLDLDKYKYQYYNDNIYTSAAVKPKSPISLMYELHGGYDFFAKSPFIGAEGGIGKVGYFPLFIKADFAILNLPSSNFQIGVRLKPKIWPIKIR